MSLEVTTLYFVRHGQSQANSDGVIAGHIDSPLTQLGIQHAREAAKDLQGVRFDGAYSSDLSRTLETARTIVGPSVPIVANPMLRERNYGTYHGTSSSAYFEVENQISARERFENPLDPSMESNRQVMDRVYQYIRSIAPANLGKTLLISSHGEIIYGLAVDLGLFSYETPKTPEYLNNGCFMAVTTPDGQKLNYLRSHGIKVD